MGFGDLGLSYEEFWRLTPYEFRQLQRGFARRVEREREQDAWLVSWLLRPHSKRPLSVDQILDRKPKEEEVLERMEKMRGRVEAHNQMVRRMLARDAVRAKPPSTLSHEGKGGGTLTPGPSPIEGEGRTDERSR